jgi:hypothetical protein
MEVDMLLKHNDYIVKINVDDTYTIDSTDNRYYDVILNPCNYKHGDLTKTLAIHIALPSKHYSIALVGSYLISDSDCAILENDILTVLLDQIIVQINILNGSIVRHIELDCFGCNLAIYRVEKGYIIYGECEITMLKFDFSKRWAFSGKDIFASVSGKLPFEIKDELICLYDFEDNYYEIDFEGNHIK